jgi:hypothetical protein
MAHGDAREGKCREKLANGVGSQLMNRDRRSQRAQRYYHVTTTMCTRRLLQPKLTPPADSNGLVLSSERRNVVSARGPSRFNPTIRARLCNSGRFEGTYCLHLQGRNSKKSNSSKSLRNAGNRGVLISETPFGQLSHGGTGKI